MTFWEHFLRLLPQKPKQALAALYWHVTRRKVGAHNRLCAASADLRFPYDLWIRRVERADALAPKLGEAVKAWSWQPRFVILLHGDGELESAQFQRSLKSIEAQSYSFWTMLSLQSHELPSALQTPDGDYVLPLQVGDELARHALFRFGERLQEEGDASILYGDHDHRDPSGSRVRPWFKPRWNAEMFLAQDYLSPAVTIEADLARRAASMVRGRFDIHTFLLRAVSEAEGSIAHVPHILAHAWDFESVPSTESRTESVRRHLQPVGANCVPGPFGTARVRWPLPAEIPKVSVIIPTRDRVGLLRACVQSLLQKTTYARYEVIIVDNGSVARPTLAYLAELESHPAVRVLRYDRPYNYSAINNWAVKAATGAFLCLLNNDTEVIEPDWLSEMMRYAVRPEIGAVGAKLLYPDRTIQHAGLVVGIGGAAGHAHRFAKADDPGYFRQPHVAQFTSAVTAACLVVDANKFDSVGGLDEENLPIALNDVDLCLKLQSAGWRNVYVPHAVLLHHESKSRGTDRSRAGRKRLSQEVSVLQRRWDTTRYDDPLHNPNLDRLSETYVIRL